MVDLHQKFERWIDEVITESIHSNEENDGIKITVWWMKLWLMIAIPRKAALSKQRSCTL